MNSEIITNKKLNLTLSEREVDDLLKLLQIISVTESSINGQVSYELIIDEFTSLLDEVGNITFNELTDILQEF